MAKRIMSVRVEAAAVQRLDELPVRMRLTRSDLVGEAIELLLSAASGTAELKYEIANRSRFDHAA